jgi:hypothetical protein
MTLRGFKSFASATTMNFEVVSTKEGSRREQAEDGATPRKNAPPQVTGNFVTTAFSDGKSDNPALSSVPTPSLALIAA